MPDRYQKLIHDLFDGQGIPEDLALYLHIPSKTDPSMAPLGGDSLYVLAPVPNLAHGINWERKSPAFRNKIIHFLKQEAGLEGLEASIVTEQASRLSILSPNCGAIRGPPSLSSQHFSSPLTSDLITGHMT